MSFTPNDLLKIYVPFACRTGACKTTDDCHPGRDHEWHLVNAASPEQFTFGHMSWLHKHAGSSGISFSGARSTHIHNRAAQANSARDFILICTTAR
jgi:hypothetical protein